LSRSDPAAQALLETLNPPAAGIDVGATELWVAVLPGSVPPQAPASDTPAAVPANVRCFGTFFGTFTADLEALLQGERDSKALAKLRRCQESAETIAVALQGTWQEEHLFELQQSLELYQYYHQQIGACDQVIEVHLKTLALPEVEPLSSRPHVCKRKPNEPTFDVRNRLYQMAGVDLTVVEGIEASTAAVVLSEIGTDMSRWPSEKHFGSWLGLAPNPKKSGGKVKSAATRPGANRAAQALRLAANNLQRSHSALGAFFRRIAARRGMG
jgi:transposase